MTKLKTINIKGKEYVEVNERIRAFREMYPTGSIMTEIVSHQDGVVVMKATIIIDNQIRATGHAYEKEGSTFINKTSYIENCETSCWGRALACLGLGLDTSVASAEEVGNAIAQQNNAMPQKNHLEEISDDDLQALKTKLKKAYENGNITKTYFKLSPEEQNHVRDFANKLRGIKSEQ